LTSKTMIGRSRVLASSDCFRPIDIVLEDVWRQRVQLHGQHPSRPPANQNRESREAERTAGCACRLPSGGRRWAQLVATTDRLVTGLTLAKAKQSGDRPLLGPAAQMLWTPSIASPRAAE
jgi:hypothetical protein